ncbi:MAG: hypothetical protein JWN03_4990 [Nocardia sp.]|nr:hypothetical protein [Nocardia sp.]
MGRGSGCFEPLTMRLDIHSASSALFGRVDASRPTLPGMGWSPLGHGWMRLITIIDFVLPGRVHVTTIETRCVTPLPVSPSRRWVGGWTSRAGWSSRED